MRCPGNRGSSRKAGVQVDEPPDSGGYAGPDDLHDGLVFMPHMAGHLM